MNEFGIGVEQLHVFQAASGMLVPAGDAAPSVANQAGGSGLGTLFNLLEIGFRLVLGVITVVAGYYIAIGGVQFMRAAGNPQMLSQARMQVALAGVGLAIALSSQLVVGTIVDFLSGASGGTIVDIGDVADVENQQKKVLPPGSFLGLYGGRAVLCPAGDTATEDGNNEITAAGGTAAAAAWGYAKGGDDPGVCTEK